MNKQSSTTQPMTDSLKKRKRLTMLKTREIMQVYVTLSFYSSSQWPQSCVMPNISQETCLKLSTQEAKLLLQQLNSNKPLSKLSVSLMKSMVYLVITSLLSGVEDKHNLQRNRKQNKK